MPTTTLLFEENPNPMFQFDMDSMRIEKVNKSAIEKYGYSEEEFTQLTLKDLRPSEEIPKLNKAFKKLSTEGSPQVVGTHRHTNKQGHEFYAKITTQPLPDLEGRKRMAHILDVTELVELRNEVKDTYEDMKHHIETNPLALIRLDREFKVIEWSKRAEEMTGYPSQKVRGKSYDEIGLFSPAELAHLREKLKQITSEKIDKDQFEVTIQTREGYPLAIRIHGSTRWNEDGTLNSVLVFFENIQEEKEYEQRLERAQKLAQCGWWSYEVQNDRVIWSDLLYDILGVERESFGGTFEDFYEMVHPADRSTLENVMKRMERSNAPIDYQLRILKGEGEMVYAECRAQSTFDSEGKLKYLSGVLQDVTEQMEARKQLKRNKELFEKLFLDAPVAIAMISKEKEVLKVNRSFTDLFGYPEDEIVGEDILEYLVPRERKQKIPKIYQNAFSGNHKYYEDERVTRQGELLNVLVGALPVRVEDELIALFGIYIDVSDLKSAQRQLQESLNEKEILLSEIHHRVKNNLAIISGLLELEGMNWDNEQIKQAFMESQLRIKSIAMIHEKLYETDDFANLQFENYVNELVEAVANTFNINAKRITTRVEADDLNLNINQAIPCALIINELVTNAIEHGFKNCNEGTVFVKMKERDHTVKINVRDNGQGLPEEGEQLFNHSLGLTLVNQLTKQLDADISAWNEDGACFEITFRKKAKSGAASNYFV